MNSRSKLFNAARNAFTKVLYVQSRKLFYRFFEFYGFRIFAYSQLRKGMIHHTLLFGSGLTACITLQRLP